MEQNFGSIFHHPWPATSHSCLPAQTSSLALGITEGDSSEAQDLKIPLQLHVRVSSKRSLSKSLVQIMSLCGKHSNNHYLLMVPLCCVATNQKPSTAFSLQHITPVGIVNENQLKRMKFRMYQSHLSHTRFVPCPLCPKSWYLIYS